jgi:hypothetical protein
VGPTCNLPARALPEPLPGPPLANLCCRLARRRPAPSQSCPAPYPCRPESAVPRPPRTAPSLPFQPLIIAASRFGLGRRRQPPCVGGTRPSHAPAACSVLGRRAGGARGWGSRELGDGARGLRAQVEPPPLPRAGAGELGRSLAGRPAAEGGRRRKVAGGGPRGRCGW